MQRANWGSGNYRGFLGSSIRGSTKDPARDRALYNLDAINAFKRDLAEKRKATPLFGNRRGDDQGAAAPPNIQLLLSMARVMSIRLPSSRLASL